MSYQALYRAWRSQTFSDLMGQPHVTQTLHNALKRERVAHAYLFCGPRGTGKTSAAKILAKAVNCLSPQDSEPCNQCSACESITNGSNVDVEEIDAASNRGVDEIRQLRDKVQYAPTSVQKKVYIVDEVHMLTTEAFNALLKTLEEPPAHTLFILATTEPHKIPPTIISRCQRFDFRRIEPEIIVNRLQEICDEKQWTYDEEALWRIADAADGGLRDALGLLEQTAAFAQGRLTAEDAAHVMGGVQTGQLLDFVADLLQGNAKAVMEQLMHWYSGGKDAARMLHEVLQLVRDLFIVKLCQDVPTARGSADFQTVANRCTEDWLLLAMQKLGEAYIQLRYVDQPRLALETVLLGLIPRSSKVAQTSSVAKSAQSESNESIKQGPVSETKVDVAPESQVAASVPATEPVAPSEKIPSKPARVSSPQTAAKRKLEVLKQLWNQSSSELLNEVVGQWDAILQAVRSERIATHAWLMNGEPVLVTEDTIVLSFASRIHRDAVMKPTERTVIEHAMSAARGHSVQVFALLNTDWAAFLQTLEAASVEAAPPSPERDQADDLVEKVVSLFGRDRVEIIEGE